MDLRDSNNQESESNLPSSDGIKCEGDDSLSESKYDDAVCGPDPENESTLSTTEESFCSVLKFNETYDIDISEMGEIIEKQLDVSNGAGDNKSSLEAKEQIYKEMAERNEELEKEVIIFKKKTIALEAEVADLKRRENELSILLDQKNETPHPSETGSGTDEQEKRLLASEEAFKRKIQKLKELVKEYVTPRKDFQRKEVKFADDLICKTSSPIMQEHDKCIAALITEIEYLEKERDTAQMHLANIELAFNDVHLKYERCKSIVQGYKDNEESFKQDIALNKKTIAVQEEKYEALKGHAMAQLEKSNQELAAMKKQHEDEIARLTVQIKQCEIKNEALTASLEQKAKEYDQLVAICNEYTAGV